MPPGLKFLAVYRQICLMDLKLYWRRGKSLGLISEKILHDHLFTVYNLLELMNVFMHGCLCVSLHLH